MMNKFYGFIAVSKFVLMKLLNFRKFKTVGLSLIYLHSQVKIVKYGSIYLNGKLTLCDYASLFSSGNLTIGKNVFINKFSRIIAFEDIILGDNILIAQFVSILDHDHAYGFNLNSLCFKGYKTSKIQIGSNVLIGDKVSILKGTTIGDNVVIGANCVVRGKIPSNSLVTLSANQCVIRPMTNNMAL